MERDDRHIRSQPRQHRRDGDHHAVQRAGRQQRCDQLPEPVRPADSRQLQELRPGQRDVLRRPALLQESRKRAGLDFDGRRQRGHQADMDRWFSGHYQLGRSDPVLVPAKLHPGHWRHLHPRRQERRGQSHIPHPRADHGCGDRRRHDRQCNHGDQQGGRPAGSGKHTRRDQQLQRPRQLSLYRGPGLRRQHQGHSPGRRRPSQDRRQADRADLLGRCAGAALSGQQPVLLGGQVRRIEGSGQLRSVHVCRDHPVGLVVDQRRDADRYPYQHHAEPTRQLLRGGAA
ncbi:hypothetical protein APY03_6187 [Variovorax sp. WDL1]|nr:hypothetical protein APY03_6187 [Variovorax sp. WDL1]